MRWLRLLSWLAGGVVVVGVVLFGALQTAVGQRALAGLVTSLVSSPDTRIGVVGLDGFFPTDFRVARMTVADRGGVWLRGEEVRLRWSFASLFTGRVRIDEVSARRLEILRAPQSDEVGASSSSGGVGLQLGIDLRSVDVPDIHLGPALAAGVDSHWKLVGSAVLAAGDAPSRLKLALDRVDGPAGHLSSDLTFNLRALSANGEIEVEEPAGGGVVAALLGRPDLDRVAAKLVASGTRDEGTARLTASAQDLLTASGEARWRRVDKATSVSFTFAAQSRAYQASLNSSGTYDSEADRLEADTTLTLAGAGPLRDRVGALDWRGLRVRMQARLAELRKSPTGTATLAATAEDFAYPPLAPMHVELRASLGLGRDGSLSVDGLDVSTPLAAVKGSGRYRTAARTGEARLSIDGSNLAVFSALAGLPLEGRTHVDFTLNTGRDGSTVAWQGSVDDLGLPQIPQSWGRQSLRLSGAGGLKKGGAWRLDRAQFAGSRASFELSGHGMGSTGELSLSLGLPDLALLRPEISGAGTVKASLSYGAGEAHGKLDVSGTVAQRKLTLVAEFTRRADGSLLLPSANGRWASVSLDARDLTVTPQGTTGIGHLAIARLADLAPVLGVDLAGALDLDVAAEPDPAGKLRIALRGKDLRGQGLGATNLQVDGTVADPLGAARADATVKVSGLNGAGGVAQVDATLKGDRERMAVELNAAGPALNAALAANVEAVGEEIRVGLQRLAGTYRNIPIALAAPAQLRITGARTAIERASLGVGSGRVSITGALDATDSDLTIQIAQLPVALLEALLPGTKVEGSLQATLRVTGPLGQPRVQATYTASGLRLKRQRTALIPALSLQGNATVADRQATFDANLTAGGATRLSFKGEALLPRGNAKLQAKVALKGTIDIAPFSPMLGEDVRGLAGTVRPDMVLTVDGDSVRGTGTAAVAGGALFLPDTGLRLDNGQGVLALQGDTLNLQQLSFQTARNGKIAASGSIGLDKGMPVNLAVTARNALVANRPDLIATISSDVKITGSPADGLEVSGPVTIDRAEIGIGVSQAANYPVLPVREINGGSTASSAASPQTAPPAPPPAEAATGGGVRLALDVRAPQAVFVRGRGLNAEVGGQFTVTGKPSRPVVLGALALRRGTFNFAGRVLNFTRGNVSLVSATTLDPQLDFAATTSVSSTTIEVDITGTARAPRIALTSSPPLPQDEAMAMLLFGKPAAGLSPGELLTAAQAISELSGGTAVGSGLMGRLRSVLGLDQLSVNSGGGAATGSGSANPSATSLQGGRYVAPGVYVGAEQGTTGASTRGVVEIEVLKHVKIEGAVGSDSNDRVGAKMEWDY
jgi:translocation and assembly module TamB